MSELSANQRSDSNIEAHSLRTDQKRAPRKTTRAPALYKALVTETPDLSSIRVACSTSDIDETVLARIKKCLERAYHANAAETEAKAALHIACRLMKQYNVSQAEVLLHEPQETQRQYGGRSCVSISRVDGDLTKHVQKNTFVGDLCMAIETFFGTKSYSQHSPTNLSIVFYGVAQNTAMAAHAFEMVFNLMLEWARPYAGRNGKNSYCVGICNGLLRLADEEKRKEEADAKKVELDAIAARVKEEEEQRQCELNRLADLTLDAEQDAPRMCDPVVVDLTKETDDDSFSTTSSASPCSFLAPGRKEDDAIRRQDLVGKASLNNEAGVSHVEADLTDDFIELTGEDDADVVNLLSAFAPRADKTKSESLPPRKSSSIAFAENTGVGNSGEGLSTTSSSDDEEHRWKSHSQLILFRDTADRIAEDYIKAQGLRIHEKKIRNFEIDQSAYYQGKKDSKKINVRGKTIKNTAAEQAEGAPSNVFHN